MERVFQQIPVLLAVLVPLPELADLVAHKIELFARVPHHVEIEGPALGEFSLVVPLHLLEDGGLAVDHLVVGEGQQIPLVWIVLHRKGQKMPEVRAVLRPALEIGQGVVRPAQVPLVVEAQAAFLCRAGHPGEGGGILGNEDGAGFPVFQAAVHLLQKTDAVLVFAPGRVSLPVDQIADGVHPQPVRVKFPQPVEGRRLQKAPHLSPGMDEVAAAPLAASRRRVGIFIKRGAVVVPQGVVVHRKVDRRKIQDHPDSALVAAVDKIPQPVGSAVSGRGAEKPGALVAPGGVAGVLGQGHKLQKVEAVFLKMGNQPPGQLLVGIPAAPFFLRLSQPGTEMGLVDVHRPVKPRSPVRHPVPVLKIIPVQRPEYRGRPGPQLAAEPVGVAVVEAPAVRAGNPVLVPHSGFGSFHPNLPEVPVQNPLHRGFLPAVEVPDEADGQGAGGIGAKDGPPRPAGVSAQKAVCFKFLPGVKCVKIHLLPPRFRTSVDFPTLTV